ncbi:MAG: GDP-mannose 4,6-dehydratase [Clostridia bacterium]|nr:GDP-mannose 4,6-dehydratase [Clostridia bacterium]
MKVLLAAGGAGFIGSFFIKYFLGRNKNFLVVNIDKLSHTGNSANLRELEDSPRYHFIKGDICNYELVNYVLKKYKPDFVINFASESPKKNLSDTDRFIERPTMFAETNIMGTMTLLEGLRYIWNRRSFKSSRFIQISTDEVYGIGENHSKSDKNYILEESPVIPETSFSASKAAADLMVSAFSRSYDIPSIIARCCTNYGPHQHTENFIPRFILNALEDTPVRISEEDYRIKEWIHVQDNSIALIRVLFYGRPGETYNLGTGEEASNVDIARKILKHLNKPESILDHVPGTLKEPRQLLLNSCKSRSHLNWSSRIRLEDGLKEMVQWYKNNFNK